MGKIRVQDLARMMGVSNQDLVFKLRSIGVRVDGEDAHIDTDIIQAILQGKQLPNPREVILRDQEEKGRTASPAARRRAPRRPSPLRKKKRRSLIQKVDDSKIKTIPSNKAKEEEEKKKREEEEAAAKAREAKAAAAEEAAEEEAEAAAAEKAEEAVAEKAEAAAAEEVEAAEAVAETAEEAEAKPAKAKKKKAEERDEEEPEETKKKKKGKAKKKARPAAEKEDLAAYKGAVEDVEEEPEAAARPTTSRRKRRAERKQKERERAKEEGKKVLQFTREKPEGPVMITEGMTVRDFADKLGVKSKDLLKAMLERGIMANINQVLEPELAEQLADELGYDAMVVSFEEEVQLTEEMELSEEEGEEGTKAPRAPVVTVMGHVDHGKTSLLDAIRKTRVAEGEAGGITQHIGAYKVPVGEEEVVFLDTPGHEAFTTMRARGARVTDLVVLVVAADDGVMPQTVEAIDHARAAGVPIVVAVNKMDKANANPDRVKKELADHELLVEEWGGETVAVPLSALKGEGIDELLEMILLTAEILELQASPDVSGHGVVVEARKEVGRGTVATVLVQNGTLSVGDVFVCGATWGRVRAMTDDRGERVEEVGPSTPVSVSGFDEVPAAGDALQVVESESRARSVAEFRAQERRSKDLAPTLGKGVSLESLFDQMEAGEIKELPVVIKADVQGSVEVLKDALVKVSTDKVKVEVIHSAVGAISTNDVILASASDAIILGFNVRPEKKAVEMAEAENVDIRLHTVIYELIDELKAAMTGLLEPIYKEEVTGRAEVREIFKVPKAGMVAGCHVIDGVIPRNAQARLLRDNRVIYEGAIESLRRFKDDVSEVRQGYDCGISLERFQDVKPGDEIEAFVEKEVAPEL